MGKARSYPLTSSPLYRLSSKRKLAAMLGVPLRDLLFLLKQTDNYLNWDLVQRRRDVLVGLPAKKSREIQQPRPLLSCIHKRLAGLLGRIEKPEFVYSATKLRCYVDNAQQHANGERAVKIDIKNFYPSVKRKFVRDFFERELQCPADVAHVLTQICCTSKTLPTGSAVSPVLSYFACSPMFGRIAALAVEHDLKFTLYVDDMVFSGAKANRDFTSLVVTELARNGFIGHKITHFKTGAVKIITGVAVSAGGVDIPFRRHKRIRQFEDAFWEATDADDIRLLGATLLGQYREAERLQPGSKLRAAPIEERLAKLAPVAAAPARTKATRRRTQMRPSHKRFAALRAAKSASASVSMLVAAIPPVGTPDT